MSSIDEILAFWIGEHGPDGSYDASRDALWWRKSATIDQEIRDRFGDLHASASRGELTAWAAEPRGRLALIIVLDQLSRHIHRDRPGAFAQDWRALRRAVEGIDRGQDRQVDPIERLFFYLPLEHAEDVSFQRRSLELFEQLAREVAEPHRATYEWFHEYAVRHARIIEKFGRFPHRNAILGRDSSPEEIEFLKGPGSSF